MERRAVQILDEAHDLLVEVERDSIWEAIGRGAFGDVKRTRTGGKGHAGVVRREDGYVNPLLDVLEGRGHGHAQDFRHRGVEKTGAGSLAAWARMTCRSAIRGRSLGSVEKSKTKS